MSNRFKYNDGDFIGENKILLVKRTYKDKYHQWYGIFICPRCGKEFETSLNKIAGGYTKQCKNCNTLDAKHRGHNVGILFKQGKDYRDKYNPFYLFLDRTGNRDNDGNYYWNAECRFCHRIYEVIPSQVISEKRSNGINPCHCQKNESIKVIVIRELLVNAGIIFQQEYKFDDCLSPKGNKMKFDFYLPSYNCCIEYDGEQHFRPVDFGTGQEKAIEKFEQQKIYDEIKTNYCKEKGIKLVRIPYSQEITIEYLLERICENGEEQL